MKEPNLDVKLDIGNESDGVQLQVFYKGATISFQVSNNHNKSAETNYMGFDISRKELSKLIRIVGLLEDKNE